MLIIQDLLINSKENFNLKLCIVTELNNVVKNVLQFPIVYGLGKLNYKCGIRS
jgi:hypothetical protein